MENRIWTTPQTLPFYLYNSSVAVVTTYDGKSMEYVVIS